MNGGLRLDLRRRLGIASRFVQNTRLGADKAEMAETIDR